MKLIVCLDDKNGMLFNGRRQSRDRAVCEKIVSLSRDNVLWMNSYSANLFNEHFCKAMVDDAFLGKAAAEDFCFYENGDILPYIDRIDMVVAFRWNRHYPADKRFIMDLTDGTWKLLRNEDFSGNSHEKITMEIYTR